MKTILLACFLFISCFMFSCSKDVPAPTVKPTDSIPNPPKPPDPPQPETFNYTSSQSANLNVIYFIPNDVAVPTEYHRRISEILIQFQDFVKAEMIRNGYGAKTFSLLKDNAKNRIKLIVINGKFGKATYPYSGGSGAVITEINEYKAAHPTDFTSEHNLIIIPSYETDVTKSPGGPPFYGLGRSCFALDYSQMDKAYLGTTGTLGNWATTWIGGLVHELGHGLNLPHNCQKVSENATLGMALMWAGNSTYGKSKTFLTAADCAILNVNQVFNSTAITYGTVNSSITRIYAKYDEAKAAIVLSGKYTSSVPVKDVIYYNDPNVNNEGTGVNRDYNAVTWASKPINNDSFYVEMPLAEMKDKSSWPFELKVKLVCENGTVKETIYNYDFLNNIPVIEFSYKPELSKTGWSVISFSSQETKSENGAAVNLIDDNNDTHWHTLYSTTSTNYPHQFIIDAGKLITANGLSITQRNGLSRAIKDAEFLTSNDGSNFTSVNNYVFANKNGMQYFEFSSPQTFRYFKIIAKTAWDGLQFASLAEIGLY